VNTSRHLALRRSETVVLALIHKCPIKSDHPDGLDIHYYSKASGMDAVDLNTLQCLVGRVKALKQWAIVDRSGNLARVHWDNDD
jgi:hypothetical protein